MKQRAFGLWFALAAVLSAFPQAWTDAQEAEVKGLIREGGFFLALQKVVRGQAGAETLAPWVARIEDSSLVGTTVRDILAALPASAAPWLVPLVAQAAPGAERDWVLERFQDSARTASGKFHLSLPPVRMDLLAGVSMVLPNYSWSISYQDPRQMTVQALEKGYSATVHLRWIDRTDLDVFDIARLVQMYAGFRPRYVVKKPSVEGPAETDLVPLAAVEPRPMEGRTGVLEQVQVGLSEAWQLYAGRTRWYEAGGRVLVVLLSVHVERDQKLADRDRALVKLGQLLDTLRITPRPSEP